MLACVRVLDTSSVGIALPILLQGDPCGRFHVLPFQDHALNWCCRLDVVQSRKCNGLFDFHQLSSRYAMLALAYQNETRCVL